MLFCSLEQTLTKLCQLLAGTRPFLCMRVGGTDYKFVARAWSSSPEERKSVEFIGSIWEMRELLGLYARSDASLELNRFIELYSDALARADMHIAVSDNHALFDARPEQSPGRMFDFLYQRVHELHNWTFFEEFYRWTEWFSLLDGKKVVLVTPFKRTMESQLERRHLLFSNIPGFQYPNFDWRIVASPITYNFGNEPDDYFPNRSWVETSELLCAQLAASDFDVALLGCGVYAAPLLSWLSRAGKSGIYLGGQLQLYFGIRGQRYDRWLPSKGLLNEYWIYPASEDLPPKVKAQIENYAGPSEGFGAYFDPALIGNRIRQRPP